MKNKALFARFVSREEYSARHAALVKMVDASSAAHERAAISAAAAIEKRFEAVNEFRQTLADQAKTYVTRAEAQISTDAAYQRTSAQGEALALLSSRLDLADGRRIGTTNGLGYIVGVGGVVLAVLQHFWK